LSQAALYLSEISTGSFHALFVPIASGNRPVPGSTIGYVTLIWYSP
jgi:hypothetical protein